MLSCEYCKFFENTYFQEHLRTTGAKIIDLDPSNKITIVLLERVPDTSGTSETQVKHEKKECNTSDKRATRVQHE